MATVINYGARTISQVRAQFSPDGTQRLSTFRTEHLPMVPQSALTAPVDAIGYTEIGYKDIGILPPGGRMRFSSDAIGDVHLKAPHAIVRRRDHLDQTWEHERGEVRRIDGNALAQW